MERRLIHQTSMAMLLDLWQRFLTKHDGERCAFRPSCSAYAREAIERDGPMGILIAADRLMREASAIQHPQAEEGGWAFVDELSDHRPFVRLIIGDRSRGHWDATHTFDVNP